MQKFMSLFGIVAFIFVAWLLSENRSRISWRTVLWGVGLQFVFAVIVLNPQSQEFFFRVVSDAVDRLLSFAEQGATFIFGTMEAHEVQMVNPVTNETSSKTFIGAVAPSFKNIAFWIIFPTIIFFSSLMSILYHLGIMQRIVSVIAWIMQRTMGTTGPESLSTAANIFVGQTEAPLVIKPYVKSMTRSELHAVMTAGFATVAGGVMAAYVGILGKGIPGIAGHLVAASIMSAPAALAISKVMLPMEDIKEDEDAPLAVQTQEEGPKNIIEAAARGASEGMTLVWNVLAMLMAFVGLMAMINWMFGFIVIGETQLSLELLLGWFFSPFAFLMGVPWEECQIVGMLLGEKLVLTEFVAYLHLGSLMNEAEPILSQRSAIIASYALCGFANFASIGIQIGGIGGIAPDRISEVAALGVRAMIGGTLAAFMTATIAGVLL
ncbi:MAG: NupC/NupG family nucleoside CNT transporter [Deltaproteobacteria bacterium]|nr:NupC/NupG family nucleoside CNT transporter [Deltaproteobacteria bacterium]